MKNVLGFVAKKVLGMTWVLLGLTIITFIITYSLPADPARAFLGPDATQEALEAVREEFGLNKSLPEQYIRYMINLFHGNLGRSIHTHNLVMEDLLRKFPATIELAIFAIIIATMLGVPIGVVSAVKRETKLDHILRVLSIGGVSLPAFFLGLILTYVFYFVLGWAPSGGRISVDINLQTITGLHIIDSIITLNWHAFMSSLHHIILPAISLSFLSLSTIARMTRSSMLESLGQDYIKTARAKGLGFFQVIVKHALRNALLPTVTIIGLTFGRLLSGSVLIEWIYRWPGLGFYVTRSILTVDFPAIMGSTLLVSAVFVIVNTIVDMSYVIIDPRIREG